PARRDGERQTGELWLGLYGNEWCRAQLLEHRGQPGGIVDDLRVCQQRARRWRWRASCLLDRYRAHPGEITELRNQRTELELGEQRGQAIGVGRLDAELLQIELDRHVAPQRHELA